MKTEGTLLQEDQICRALVFDTQQAITTGKEQETLPEQPSGEHQPPHAGRPGGGGLSLTLRQPHTAEVRGAEVTGRRGQGGKFTDACFSVSPASLPTGC